jgi:hypothetical protein
LGLQERIDSLTGYRKVMASNNLLKLLVIKGSVQKVVQPIAEDPSVVLEKELPDVFSPLIWPEILPPLLEVRFVSKQLLEFRESVAALAKDRNVVSRDLMPGEFLK